MENKRPRPIPFDEHPCILVVEPDVMSIAEQFLVGCRCHGGQRRIIWRSGDPEFRCDGVVK